jgi:hypothetical protein
VTDELRRDRIKPRDEAGTRLFQLMHHGRRNEHSLEQKLEQIQVAEMESARIGDASLTTTAKRYIPRRARATRSCCTSPTVGR